MVQFKGVATFFCVWRRNKAAPSLTASAHKGETLNREAARQCGSTLVKYESCIVQVSYVTCDHVRRDRNYY